MCQCEKGRSVTLKTGLLIDHPETLSPLADLYEAQWPQWYNAKGASARADLSERVRRDALPLGIVAFIEGGIAGTCALTASSGGGVTERSPWVSGLLVRPRDRHRGVGQALLERAAHEASRLGHRRIYALTADADLLFIRAGWIEIDRIDLSGVRHAVYSSLT